MKTLLGLLALLGLTLATALALLCPASAALAQQVAQETTCTILADAGVAGDGGTFACPVIATNYQPTFATCQFSTPAHESMSGTIIVEGCATATNCGPIADAGFALPYTLGGATAATYSLSSTTNDKNTWPYLQPVAIGTTGELSDGGAAAAGYANCTFGVIQSQTIHLARPKIIKTP
jgi:hypothetical protein